MHTMLQQMSDQPAWQQQVRPRLVKSMVLAVLLLAGSLLLLELPKPPTLAVDSAIVFELLPEPEPTQVEPEVPIETVLPPEVTVAETTVEEASQSLEAEEPNESTDWYESLDRAVRETVSAPAWTHNTG